MGDSDKVLEGLFDQLSKKYNKTKFGLSSQKPPIRFISTGNIAVDWVIGKPGVPLGRVIEIIGRPETGKSMLSCHLLAGFQQAGGISILLDSEESYTEEWAERMGVDWEKLIYFVPENVEEAFSFLKEDIIDSLNNDEDTPVCVVVDSFSAMPTATENDSDFGGRPRSEHARIASFAFRKLTKPLADKNTSLVFVSQLKDDPSSPVWASNETSLGGWAPKFHAALRMKLSKVSTLTSGDDHLGMTVRVQATKNKTGGAPKRSLDIDFYWENGIDPDMGYFALGLKLGLIKSSGSWYSVEGREKKFRSTDWPGILNDSFRDKIEALAFPEQESDTQ